MRIVEPVLEIVAERLGRLPSPSYSHAFLFASIAFFEETYCGLEIAITGEEQQEPYRTPPTPF